MITFRDLSYTYAQGRQSALSGINWQVTDGEFVLVAGPSGSGKSTLLRCINGLIPHFSGGVLSGEVEVYGVNAVAAGPRVLSRLVGFVAQDPDAQAVVDRVESEIAFALENAAIPPAEMRVRVEEVLDLLDLTAMRDRNLQTLSGGERQRLAIATALALRPRVLVLDEPTSQLDPQSAEDVLRALVRLNEDLGLTIVLAEHRLERIVRYVDRITWLENGHIAQDGPVRDVLNVIDAGPPLIRLARELDWQPLPLTIKEGKQFTARYTSNFEMSEGEETSTIASPVSETLLEVKGLRFAYNGRQTLKDVDLRIASGEAVALVGRNGAGKSTFLKCIVGLLKTYAGEVLIAGRSTGGRSVADICRDVGYLPQNPDDLLFAETVSDELQITLRNHRLPRSADGGVAMIQRLGLDGLAEVYPRDLSVGQRQRVALGAVTITQPRLLLLDEPTRGLDSMLKRQMVTLWRSWLEDGAAILLVTHDVELAAMIATRTILLSQGEVIASGATRQVLGSSPHFAPQITRLFPGQNWLTVEDVLSNIKRVDLEKVPCPV